MSTRFLTSLITVPLTFLSLVIVSTSCKGQTNIDLTNLFSSANQFDLRDIVVDHDEFHSHSKLDEQSGLSLPTQMLVDRAPNRFQPALYEWQNQDELAAIEYVAFRHLNATKFTESTYTPELKIGYSQPLKGFVNTIFNVSVASIKPCAKSFLNNALSVLESDRTRNRSTFLSVSVHSKF